MPLEYSWQWHTTKNQKNYDSDICSVGYTQNNKQKKLGKCLECGSNLIFYAWESKPLTTRLECYLDQSRKIL